MTGHGVLSTRVDTVHGLSPTAIANDICVASADACACNE
jgi:hypothetical protein